MTWKVPLRRVYGTSFSDMLRQAFWCHVVLRIFPSAVELGSDGLFNVYHERPSTMYEQYRSLLREPSISGRGVIASLADSERRYGVTP